MKIYLAGKIGPNDWRHDIVQGLEQAIAPLCTDYDGFQLPTLWPVLSHSIFLQHDYVGPFFAPDKEGDSHSYQWFAHGTNNHGNALNGGYYESTGALTPEEYSDRETTHNNGSKDEPAVRQQLVGLCLKAITKADVVFAWLDSMTAYGTLVELGFAAAHHKPIWIGYPKSQPYDQPAYADLWFAESLSQAKTIATSASEALWNLLHNDDKPNVVNGYVYVLESGGFYKIGKSINVDKRITQISPKTPQPVTHIHTIASNDMNWAEALLHRRYARYRSNGEWFKLPPNELRWIVKTPYLLKPVGAN